MTRFRHASLTACSGFVVTLHSLSAFASGREGEQYVEIVRWFVGIALVALIASLAGRVIYGGYKANQKGESVLKGAARGIRKGILAFLALCAVAAVGLTVAGALWMAFVFFYQSSIRPST